MDRGVALNDRALGNGLGEDFDFFLLLWLLLLLLLLLLLPMVSLSSQGSEGVVFHGVASCGCVGGRDGKEGEEEVWV
eukprot:evm.model.NODE_1649_length_17895_cov_23.691254.1